MLKKCPKCHYTETHPFGINITSESCSGCSTHSEKDSIDWLQKRRELEIELGKYKKKGIKYDCVVPVVGDAEDFYTLSIILDLGLSPLVVCVNDYFKNDIGWHNIQQLITYFDVDSFIYNPDMRVYKDLIRTSLRKYDHMLLPFLQLHTSFPVHVAYERKIPLIIWGQNQSVEQVGKFSHYDNVEMSKWSRRQHDLFEKESKDLIGNGAQVDLRHLNYYQYPNVSKLGQSGVRGIYLSNYFRWDPLYQNSSVVKYGFIPELNSSSFDVYERAGSSVYYQLHDLLKYKRVGYRKIADHVAREIRHNRISSGEGELLISEYSLQKVYIKPFFDWLGSTKSGYDWFIKHKLSSLNSLIAESKDDISQSSIKLPNNIADMIVDAKKCNKGYITFGKGLYI